MQCTSTRPVPRGREWTRGYKGADEDDDVEEDDNVAVGEADEGTTGECGGDGRSAVPSASVTVAVTVVALPCVVVVVVVGVLGAGSDVGCVVVLSDLSWGIL